jgi:hypothetical protein
MTDSSANRHAYGEMKWFSATSLNGIHDGETNGCERVKDEESLSPNKKKNYVDAPTSMAIHAHTMHEQ